MSRNVIANELLVLLRQFAQGTATGMGTAVGRNLAETVYRKLQQFFMDDPNPPEAYYTVFGGRAFRITRQQFIQRELQPTIQYLRTLPVEQLNVLLHQAMQNAQNDPDQTLIELIKIAQAKRHS